MKAQIVLLPGDGVGPEVTQAVELVFQEVAARFGHTFDLIRMPFGVSALEKYGTPLPPETLEVCQEADALFLGAVGHPHWRYTHAAVHPEAGLLELRRALDLFVMLRPLDIHPALVATSPFRPEVLEGVSLMLVRELRQGVYYGPRQEARGGVAYDTIVYDKDSVAEVVRFAAQLAARRQKYLVSVDKANVLATSRLWRQVAEEVVTRDFPEVTLEHMLVDTAAFLLVRRPSTFDVLVTENLFGDILADVMAALVGSVAVLPTASLSRRRNALGHRVGLYAPAHGAMPELAGEGVANPIGAIYSAAWLLTLSLGLEREAEAVYQAVRKALDEGYRTVDLAVDTEPVSTREMTRAILRHLAD